VYVKLVLYCSSATGSSIRSHDSLQFKAIEYHFAEVAYMFQAKFSNIICRWLVLR